MSVGLAREDVYVCDGTAVLARRGSSGYALEHVLMALMGMYGERGG